MLEIVSTSKILGPPEIVA